MQGSNRTVKFEKSQKERVSKEFRGRGRKLNKPQRGKNRWENQE